MHENTEEYFAEFVKHNRNGRLAKLEVERASRFIYLNKTCFNGLHRVNSRDEFNVPFGSYKNPTIVDHNSLLACSKALRNAELVCDSFIAVEKFAARGDFIYFDPPFVPLSRTATFTAYNKDGFSSNMQTDLRDLSLRLTEKGVHVLISNSHTPMILDLYRGFRSEPSVRPEQSIPAATVTQKSTKC